MLALLRGATLHRLHAAHLASTVSQGRSRRQHPQRKATKVMKGKASFVQHITGDPKSVRGSSRAMKKRGRDRGSPAHGPGIVV
jgi:hypothetical protein